MPTGLLYSLCVFCVLLVLACSGDEDETASSVAPTISPSVTAATPTARVASPEPSLTPEPTATPEPTPSPSPMPEPTLPPASTAAPVPGFVTVTAADLAYVNANPVVRAGEVTIVLSNVDNGVPHDLSIDGLGASGDCTGPCTVEIHFVAAAGTYAFHCTFHPDMTGTLTVVP